jgi:hypothetical protein
MKYSESTVNADFIESYVNTDYHTSSDNPDYNELLAIQISMKPLPTQIQTLQSGMKSPQLQHLSESPLIKNSMAMIFPKIKGILLWRAQTMKNKVLIYRYMEESNYVGTEMSSMTETDHIIKYKDFINQL